MIYYVGDNVRRSLSRLLIFSVPIMMVAILVSVWKTCPKVLANVLTVGFVVCGWIVLYYFVKMILLFVYGIVWSAKKEKFGYRTKITDRSKLSRCAFDCDVEKVDSGKVEVGYYVVPLCHSYVVEMRKVGQN